MFATLTSMDGQRIDLAALYGRQPVYLKFWATWCKPCNEQAPEFEQLYQQYGRRIAVAFRAFGVQHIPTIVMLDAQGRISKVTAP